MFVLTRFSDLIRLPADTFGKPVAEAIEDEINTRYANRVVLDVGLCICLYDIISLDDGLIKPGDGAVYIQAEFRMVVFRPFIGEVLTGTISSCIEEGIKVRLAFFDDILIPKHLVFENCVFIPQEQAWVWRNEGDLYLDANETIRFRVEQEIFTDQSPKGPQNIDTDSNQPSHPSYSIIGSCQTDGMGIVEWWD